MPIPDRLKVRRTNKKLVDKMSALCDGIERELDSGGTADALLDEWHTHARRRCEPSEFQTYWKSVSKRTFVRGALNPKPSFDKELVYSEALAVLDAVSKVEVSESESMYYLNWLEALFPGSNMSDLIYWPDAWFGDASLFRDASGAFRPESALSNDQILGYAMAKSGRAVPGAPTDIVLPFTL